MMRRSGARNRWAHHLLPLALVMVLLLQSAPVWAAEQAASVPGGKVHTASGVQMRFDEATGDLIGITLPVEGSEPVNLDFDAAYVDFAYDGGDGGWEAWGCYLRNTLFYQNLDFLATYDPPQDILYNHQNEYPRRAPKDPVFEELPDGMQVRTVMDPFDDAGIFFELTTRYRVHPDGYVMMDADIKNINEAPMIINGAATVVSGLDIGASAVIEAPGNLPYQAYVVTGMQDRRTVQWEYASPLIHAMQPDSDINLIFANPMEKWKPSITKVGDDKVDVINLSCTIDLLQPGETLTLGTQYLQAALPQQGYEAAQKLYTGQGWIAPTDGVRGAMVYSGHPAGVSDNDFQDAEGTLDAYAETLPSIAALGFDSLWMLPVFEHPQSGGSVYLPYNMEYIDARYSKRALPEMTQEEARKAAAEEMADFGKAAEAAGLRLMIDYVPHGPYKYNPDQVTDPENIYDNPWMTEERKAWRTMDRWWEDPDPAYTHDREEWNCYAFDFANTDYLEYMRNLAKKQAEEFSLTGTRIDAVMGSVPNWTPQGDNRVSQTGLYGGAVMTGAIRQGFLDAGKTPLVLPENNNPTPCYATVTDLFYDTPFYRVTLAARRAGASEQQFAAIVAHWLKAEKASAVEGMQFGRFLENHDTVAPWYGDFFDGKRAVEVYGPEKSRALWTLLSTIDGSLILYQNDEIGNETFFADLLAMRKAQFGADNGLGIEYYNDSRSGIVAYRRFDEETQNLVLVNLTDKAETRDFSETSIGGVRLSTAHQSVVYVHGTANIEGDKVTLAPYSSVVINLVGGEAYDAVSGAKPFITTHLKMEEIVARSNYAEAVSKYVSFPIAKPDVSPAAASSDKVYDPVAQYSGTTSDGDYWKYMYLNPNDGAELSLLTALNDDAVGVWRIGDLGAGFRWAGCGVNNTYPGTQYFELDTDHGSNQYGVLVFVAPEAGAYTIPAFPMVGTGEAETAILVVLRNGEQVFVSDMLSGNFETIQVAAQEYMLEAGDTLMFYLNRMDGGYAYAQLDGMRIEYKAE